MNYRVPGTLVAISNETESYLKESITVLDTNIYINSNYFSDSLCSESTYAQNWTTKISPSGSEYKVLMMEQRDPEYFRISIN